MAKLDLYVPSVATVSPLQVLQEGSPIAHHTELLVCPTCCSVVFSSTQ